MRPYLLLCVGAMTAGCATTSPVAPIGTVRIPTARPDTVTIGGVVARLRVDAAQLNVDVTSPHARTMQATDDVFALSISQFTTPGTFTVKRVALSPTTLDVTYTITHPFAAPSNLAGPPTATNRADLGIAGRVLFLADIPTATGSTYFTDVIANTALVANADGYLRPKQYLGLTGFMANTFAFKRIVDEALDPRTATATGTSISNGGTWQGNYEASSGWQQINLGLGNDGWTGYGVLHQGQTAENLLQLDLAALQGGPLEMQIALLVRYVDPRGGTTAAQRKANRLPPVLADVTQFVYREPHGAVDLEQVAFDGESGGFVADTVSSSMLSFAITDLDAQASETAQSDLALETDPRKVAQGESGEPSLDVCIPGVLGDATVSVPLVIPSTAGTGTPDAPLLFTESVAKPGGSGQTVGTYTGMVRATDSEAVLSTDWFRALDPNLVPLVSPPDPAIYQAFTIDLAAGPPADNGWVATYGGAGSTVLALATAVDALTGTSYTTGSFSAMVDFDPGPAVQNRSAGATPLPYCLALDSAGEFLWVATFAAPGGGAAPAVACAPDGSIRITGLFNGTADFDPGPGSVNRSSAGLADAFCLALSSTGAFMWVATLGGPSVDQSRGCTVDALGNTLVTGPFQGTADFDPGAGVQNRMSSGADDAYCVSLSGTGSYQWVASWGGSGIDYGYGVATDDSAAVRICGRWQNTVDFDPGAGLQPRTAAATNPAYDSYVLGLSATGAYQWASTYGGAGSSVRAHAIVVDSSGQSCIEAPFVGTVDFDPGPGIVNRSCAGAIEDDCSVLALSPAGAFQWVATWGGIGGDTTLGIGLDPADDSLRVTGTFYGTADFDPGAPTDNRTSVGLQDAYCLALSSSGAFRWVAAYGGAGDDIAHGCAVDSNSAVRGPGWFNGTADFDPDLGVQNRSANGTSDGFLLKLTADGSW